MEYIPKEKLAALRLYKYSGVDKSFISKYIMQPYWSRLVLLFPLWVAPNLITLLGLCFVAVNVVILLVFSPDLSQDCPSWVYFSFAIGLFGYTSFDAIDGKQARRTSTSGPLGELFDHGCDAINTTFGAIITAHVVNVGQSWRMVAFLFVALAYFYCTTWETYHTGTLYLGYINGPVEGTLFLCFIYVLTGFVGRGIWLQPLSTLLGNSIFQGSLEPFGSVLINDAAFVGFCLMSLGTIVTSVLSVLEQKSKERRSVVPALFGLVPMIIFLAFAALWLYLSPSDILNHQLVVFSLAIGLDFAMLVARIILAHLTHARFPMVQPGLVILAIIGGLQLLQLNYRFIGPVEDSWLLWTYFSYTVLHYVHMTVCVVQEICDYLDIYCLAIKPKRESVSSR